MRLTPTLPSLLLLAGVGIASLSASNTLRLRAQVPAGQSPAFEVASVKPNPNAVREAISLQPDGVRYTGFRLRTLIAMAYGTATRGRFDQFLGGPSWLDTERFDIVARTTGDISAVDAQGIRPDRLMLRTLLEERFSLRVHPETRQRPAFALRLARRNGVLGPAIHRSTIECPRLPTGASPPVDPERWCGIRALGGMITGHSVPLSQIGANLSGYPEIDRLVFDQTGVDGRYDFQIEYAPTLPDSSASDTPADAGPSLFTALQEQLGLKLVPIKTAVDVLVIDHVEKPMPD